MIIVISLAAGAAPIPLVLSILYVADLWMVEHRRLWTNPRSEDKVIFFDVLSDPTRWITYISEPVYGLVGKIVDRYSRI